MNFREKSLYPSRNCLKVFHKEGFRKIGIIRGEDSLEIKLESRSLLILLIGGGRGRALTGSARHSIAPGDMIISAEPDGSIEISLKGDSPLFCFFEFAEENARFFSLRGITGRFPTQGDPLRIPLMMDHLLFDSSCGDTVRTKMVEEGSLIILRLLDMKLYRIYPSSLQIIHSRLAGLNDAISLNPSEQWNNSSMAAHAGFSTSHLIKLYRDLYGCTPGKMLWKIRMDIAEELLLENPLMRIREVAEAVGYTDPFAFSNSFKRKFGECPRAYRKRTERT